MKINSNCDSAVISSNLDLNGTSFKILANAQAFKILTDNLYTNKIPTIVRELSCNAWDSQVLKGNTDKPYDIFVPDLMENYFYIRDYGVGLSEEAMNDLYSVYFGSDKNTTNELIGGLGLGSKTPLCYTEQFSVTSYYGGYEKQYQVFINEKGVPKLQKIIEKKSKEPTGFKVQIAVQQKDILEFQEAIKDFYSFNGIRPNFLNHNIELPELQVKFQYKNLTIYRSKDNLIKVKLGKVNYNLNRSDISQTDLSSRSEQFYLENKEKYPWLREYNLTRYVRDFFTDYYKQNGIMVIEFPIGSLSVTASRESLSLDEHSRETLQKALFELASEIYINQHLKKEEVIEQATVKSYVEFMKNYNSDICQTDIDTLRFKDDSIEIVNGWCKLTSKTYKQLNEIGSLYYLGHNSNKKYRSVSNIYARDISTNGYLFKLYIGTNTMNCVADYATEHFSDFPETFCYLKVKPSLLENAKTKYKKLNKYIFNIEPISIEVVKKAKTESIPLFDRIDCKGVKYIDVDNSYDSFYGFLKNNFESTYPNKNEKIYYMDYNGDDYMGRFRSCLLAIRYKHPDIKRLFILKPRQISTLTKVGYKLINVKNLLDKKFVSKFRFRYELRNSIRYGLNNIGDSFYNCFSEQVKQKIEAVQKVFDNLPDSYLYEFDSDVEFFRSLWNDKLEAKWKERIRRYIDKICLEDIKARRKEVLEDIFDYLINYQLADYNSRQYFNVDYMYLFNNKNALLTDTCKYIREQVKQSINLEK